MLGAFPVAANLPIFPKTDRPDNHSAPRPVVTGLLSVRCSSAEASLQVFDDMAELGVVQVPQHFVTFLVAAAEAPLSSRQIQQAIARTLAYRSDCSVFSALLRFCLAQGIPERAVDVWRTIQKVGFFCRARRATATLAPTTTTSTIARVPAILCA